MKFIKSFLLAIMTINNVLSAPLQEFGVTVLSSGPSDTSCHTLSLYPPGVSSSGISTVLDGTRGYAWERLSSTANVDSGLLVEGSTCGKSYTKALWMKMFSWGPWGFPTFMQSTPIPSSDGGNYGFNETAAHLFNVGINGYLYAGHSIGSSGVRWHCYEYDGYGTVLPTNEWLHVAVTYDSSTGYFNFYRNGTLTYGPCGTGSTNTRDNWNGSTLPTLIGNWKGYGFNGRFQDIQQYNTALTQAQIQQIVAQPF